MRRFRFRLERVLGLRRSREEAAREGAAAAAREAACRRADRDMATELVYRAGMWLARPSGRVAARELAASAAYLLRVRRQAGAAESALDEAERVRRERVAEAVAAWRSRRILDRLKSRKMEVWLFFETTAEQKEIDDISAAARRRSG